jgi:hypothetical protein
MPQGMGPNSTVAWTVGALRSIRCAPHGEGAPLSSSALRLLRALRRFPPEELAALRLPAATLLEVDRALRGSILALYGREPRSRSFLDEVIA